MIEGLCKEVEGRMTNVGVKGVKVTLKVKQRKSNAPPPPKYLGHGSCHNLSKSVEVRHGKATRDWKRFYEVAMEMLQELKVDKDDVRGMGVVISKLIEDDSTDCIEASPKQSIARWFHGQDAKSSSVKATRKVDFFIPAEISDAIHSVEDIEDASISSDVICVGVTTNGRNKPDSGHNNDIALPAYSQIHMSQVLELPSPMRDQIISKMEKEKGQRGLELPVDNRATATRDVRFRQTDVKRMFRLASVKSGTAAVMDESGQAISLTQLEYLPLDLQLEIANEDSNGLGPISPEKKKSRKEHPKTWTAPTMEVYETSKPDVVAVPPLPMQCHDNHINGDSIVDDQECFRRPNFVNDNILPLAAYLDRNAPENVDARRHVAKFLCICVSENRLSDTVVLLQYIKNRTDVWSSTGFESIFDIVNRQVRMCYRANLDKEWLVQL
jgi:impB/mucB/samB family C-terminal domain